MDVMLMLFGFFAMLVGILGSFLPLLPGPSLSWVGLLMLYLTTPVPEDWWILGVTLGVVVTVLILDNIIPALGTKKFGGTKAGMIGTTIGLLVSIFIPILGPFGIIIWPFVGALVGELINKADKKVALRAAFGSFLGFLTGTFIRFMVTLVFLGIFLNTFWKYKAAFFLYFD